MDLDPLEVETSMHVSHKSEKLEWEKKVNQNKEKENQNKSEIKGHGDFPLLIYQNS
jgi:hypothetical protein